jgi:hypothetical protein
MQANNRLNRDIVNCWLASSWSCANGHEAQEQIYIDTVQSFNNLKINKRQHLHYQQYIIKNKIK